MRHVSIGIFLLVILAGNANAQQSACLERTVPLSLSSKDGRPAPELTAASLEGSYGRELLIVKSVELEKTPPRVVLLIDTSGSMQRRAGAEMDVAEAVLSKLPVDTEVGLAFFAQDTIPVAQPTPDRRGLMSQLESLRRNPPSFRGKTALRAALIDSIKIFGSSRPGDSIYLISDAGDNLSMTNPKSVQRALGGAGIRIFAFVTTGGTRGATPEELSGPIEIQSLIESTGGTTVVATESHSGPFPSHERVVLADKDGNPTQLGESISRQIDQLAHFYRVEIELPKAIDKPQNWKLQFAISGTNLKSNFTLTYPRMVWPCL